MSETKHTYTPLGSRIEGHAKFLLLANGHEFDTEATEAEEELFALYTDAHALLREAEEAATVLLDTMETCHICKCSILLDESPVHCEDCSGECEGHDLPDCVTIKALHQRLRNVLARIRAFREGNREGSRDVKDAED